MTDSSILFGPEAESARRAPVQSTVDDLGRGADPAEDQYDCGRRHSLRLPLQRRTFRERRGVPATLQAVFSDTPGGHTQRTTASC